MVFVICFIACHEFGLHGLSRGGDGRTQTQSIDSLIVEVSPPEVMSQFGCASGLDDIDDVFECEADEGNAIVVPIVFRDEFVLKDTKRGHHAAIETWADDAEERA